jgi:hypothetical protein
VRPLYVYLLALFMAADKVVASGPASREIELADLQLRGMKDSRDRLTSGVFRASGTEYRAGGLGSPNAGEPVKVFCAFDYKANLFRFDRDMPFLIGNRHSRRPFKVDREKGMYVRTPEYSLDWTTEQPDQVFRRAPGAKPPALAIPFDVRCLGLAYTGTLTHDVSFRERYQGFSESRIVAAVDEGGGACRVTWEAKKFPGTFETVWFDQRQGYSPIRIELRAGSPSASLLQLGETTWRQIMGVWVPRTFLGEDYDGKGKVESKMELAFEWESVNQPAAEILFTTGGMGLPPGVIVYTEGTSGRAD